MKAYILLVLIIILSALLRFNNLSSIYVFNFDEEYQATYAWTLVKDFHPIWIGVSSSFLDFYLGPYFTYFTAFLLKISNGDPMLTAYFAAFLGILTTAATFFIGWKIFNLTTGAVSSLLYATLPLTTFFDQKYWNTMFTPIIAILLFLTLYLVKKSVWFWVAFAALFGIILETHLEPVPLLLIGIWYFLKNKVWKNIKVLFVCILVFLLFYWPLIVFDLKHNFSNITSFTRLGRGLSESKITFDPKVKLLSIFDTMGRFWYLQPGNPNADEINFACNSLTVKPEFKNVVGKYSQRTNAPVFLSMLTLILLLLFLVNIGKKQEYKLLAVILSVGFFSFIIYPGASSEYYTLSILVLFTFVPGILISRLNKNYQRLLLILVIIVCLFGINTVMKTSNEFSLAPKRIIINKVMNIVGNESFSIEGRGICHNYEGWRYLFKVYGRVPSQSYTDKNLGWLYPQEISTQPPTYTIILSEDRIPLTEDLSSLQSIKEGGYRAYIRKN